MVCFWLILSVSTRRSQWLQSTPGHLIRCVSPPTLGQWLQATPWVTGCNKIWVCLIRVGEVGIYYRGVFICVRGKGLI